MPSKSRSVSESPECEQASDATTHGTPSSDEHSPQRGERRTPNTSRRTARWMHNAGRAISVNGARPTPSGSVRTGGRTRASRMTTSPSGDVIRLYMQARRQRKAPYKRDEVFAHWGGACVYCWGVAEHLDHVTPLSRGGRDILSNVVPACADCNLSKAALSLAEWAVIDTTECKHNSEESGARQ
ncbi:HNH endonuclease [Streptomyces chartreusis]|uniref:HNH endonuclease n=1 Tax=Streptomyces chartreusis TaxID=1969 RepID=UPI003D902E13